MKNKRIALVAPVAVLALTLAGCSAGGSNSEGSGSSDYVVKVDNVEPQSGLIPANVNEVGGGLVLDAITSNLVYCDENGEVKLEDAESIKTDDNQTYTIKLRKGLKFSDGSPITAKSYVDAWNWAAKASNANLSASFFEPIEGFDAQKDSELNLKVVDDLTFKVKLSQPEFAFQKSLVYSAFAPLPESFYKDPKAYGQKPVGSGPYVLTKWEHNKRIEVRPNKNYNGPRKAHNGGIDYVLYQQEDAAYNDLLSNNLDVIKSVPSSQLANFKSDLGDRAVMKPYAGTQALTIPSYLEHFGWDEEGQLRRKAISMAIDRQTIIDKIFKGTRKAAVDFTSPAVAGYDGKVPGNEVLKYNPEEAKKAWEKANAIKPWSGSFELAYNADSSHRDWVEAATNSIKEVLKIDAKGKPYAQFSEMRKDATEKKLTSAVRSGWQADYPWGGNFLRPIHSTGAGSNDAVYANPEFDALLKKSDGEVNEEAAIKALSKAQEILMRDLPTIQLWYAQVSAGYSENVKNVKFGWNSTPLLWAVEKK
ncbi:ABC transporter substrate-binding protein [Actinomyces sp. zg-332]|uniref:peptide ABC transporter substrate-binding protein n=1 Tax=Actinomyces sp. zg-332 TaxID=2708340 RepID=UPI00142070A0|nr:ABC transporter substrate-binding protein [Actinomyces sp. zg-332]QPK94315.1 ABC transporter substrate-binding protein [Actinomyces sp. zg-332]